MYWDKSWISSPSIDSIDVAGSHNFDKQGKLSLLLTNSTWQKLAEEVDSDNPKKINLYVEIGGVDTFCKNWRIAKTRKLENNQLIKQYILADSKTANTYLTNKVTVVDKTQVLAYFANQDRLLLKDTIKYGDPLMAVVRVLLSKQDAEKQTEAAFLSRYLMNIIENTKSTAQNTKDRTPGTYINRKQKEKSNLIVIDKLDAEKKYYLELKTTTDLLSEKYHKGLPDNQPRCFYLLIYDKGHNSEGEIKQIYQYPERYGTDKENDIYLIDSLLYDENDTNQWYEKWLEINPGKTKADWKNYVLNKLAITTNYFLQLKIAKKANANYLAPETSPVVIGESTKQCTYDGECVCKNLIWGNKLNCEERKKVIQVCANIWGENQKKEKANMLMAVMHLETEATFSPSSDNKRGYVGLVQFHSTTAGGLGTTTAALKKMTFIQQMDYVEKYLKQNKDKMNTLVDFYLQIIKPNAVGNGNNPNYIVFDESISVPDGDGSNTSDEQRKKNIIIEPWVTKYGYASNPPFMVEEGEYSKRRKWVYTRQRYEERYGFHNGKTYIWEIEQVINQKHFQPGINHKFTGPCVNAPIKQEKQEKVIQPGMPPWMVIAWEEYNKYKDCYEKDSPLKEHISDYFKLINERSKLNYNDAWCGVFVNWCFEHTQEYKDTNRESAQAARGWGPANNPYLVGSGKPGWSKGERCEPFYGAVVVLKSFSHVAFLVGYNSSTNQYIYLGGNQGGGDGRAGYQKIRIGAMSKSNFLYIMKPKGYVITEENKILPESMETAEDSAKSTR